MARDRWTALCAAALLGASAAEARTIHELAERVERSGLFGRLEVMRMAREDPRPDGLLQSAASALRARCAQPRESYLGFIQDLISFGVEADLSAPGTPVRLPAEPPALEVFRGRVSETRRALRQEGLNLLGEGLNVAELADASARLRGSLASLSGASRANIESNLDGLGRARDALSACYAAIAGDAVPGYAPEGAAPGGGEGIAGGGRCARLIADFDAAFRDAPQPVQRAQARLYLALSEIREGGQVRAFPDRNLSRDRVAAAVAAFRRATREHELTAEQEGALAEFSESLPGIDCAAAP